MEATIKAPKEAKEAKAAKNGVASRKVYPKETYLKHRFSTYGNTYQQESQ